MWHITVRMAWHDRGWDGRVCDDPAANTYCSGNHSLLSERLAREKRLDMEEAATNLDAKMPAYLPPCFWTSSAFAERATQIVHRHPFGSLRDKKIINGELLPNSVYTWPFRLAITHKSHKRNGNYFPDLEMRIERYRARLNKGQSLIFLYLNYDNPVSADEYKYALVGCARLSDHELSGSFSFEKGELETIRNRDGMKNFPTLNWAIRLSHDGEGSFVRLPYHEYLAHITEHPEDEKKLEQIRVLIDEPSLLPGFKYVSEQINDDQALALLYKLKRAFSVVQEHGIVDAEDELEILDQYIEQTWGTRGLYPGLGSVVSVLADLAEGEPRKESPEGQRLIDAICENIPADDLLGQTFSLLQEASAPPTGLAAHRTVVRDARAGLRDNRSLLPLLRKLSLFALTPRQVARILFPDRDGRPALGTRPITAAEIERNPYLLCESYVPATDEASEDSADLDREQRTDGPIDYFTIDIGMFPDKRFVNRNEELQDLTVAGPERLRAFAVEALYGNEALGHSFAPLSVLVEEAVAHPLFYRESIALTDDQFLSDDHLAHFQQRLYTRGSGGQHFFYLQETKDAEDIINRFVAQRLALPDLEVELDWLDDYLNEEARELAARISNFDAATFKEERHRLVEGVMRRRIYCVTGRPGSGKTQAVHALLNRLEELGETATVLAPTGKAALRLTGEAGSDATWKAETIDRWMFRSGFGGYVSGGEPPSKLGRSAHYLATDNLVIDETSMVDLRHLALLFRAIEVHQPVSINRVILVGDENQLPPISCGRPFYDIISYLRGDTATERNNIIRLTTNCRQEHDSVVLDAAHLFAGKNRYHTELSDRLLAGGQISPFLRVECWQNTEELQEHIAAYLDDVLTEVPDHDGISREQAFNKVMRLYDSGFVPKNDASALALDRGQLLTPYRGGPSGSLGLSDYVRTRYRHDAWSRNRTSDSGFAHSDKVIRTSNLYMRNLKTRQTELRLSNGSIGVLCNNKGGAKAYFPECEQPLYWDRMDEEDFELAYGITVHKAQGSEFAEVLVVLPERRALLSRELVYTALTRSRSKLTLLIQKTPRLNPLQVALDRSVLLVRNSSIFVEPFDSRRIVEPEQGVRVKSKIEYIIYTALQEARNGGELTFAYEEKLDLPIDGKMVTVKPDFTIWCSGKTFYWEHLGMLDRADYSRNWRRRLMGYRAANLDDSLVTTDDLGGVRLERLRQVVADLRAGGPSGDAGQAFSGHHYSL